MISGIDHPVIVARSLDAAASLYEALGFIVEDGGSHPGKGTRNALVRFQDCYLELLEVTDVAEAMAAGAGRPQMVEYLDRVEAGTASFALVSNSLSQDVARMRSAGLAVPDPAGSKRARPDGTVVGWRVSAPFPVVREPFPFLIEWTPGPRPTAAGSSVPHPNGAVGIKGVAVAVPDLGEAASRYEILVGSSPGPEVPVDDLDAVQRTILVGDHEVALVAPRHPGNGPVAELLTAEGPGPFRINIEVAQIDRLEQRASDAGLGLEPIWPSALRLDQAPAAAAMLAFLPGAESPGSASAQA